MTRSTSPASIASTSAGGRGRRPSARCAPIDRRRRPTCTGRGSRPTASAKQMPPGAGPSIDTSAGSPSSATSADRAHPQPVQLPRGHRPDAPQHLDGQRVQERQLAVGRDDEQPVRLGDPAGHLREELGARDADRDRQPDPFGHVARAAARRSRSRGPRSGAARPTSRNASSIEMPSTSGVVSRNTSKTARLAAVYAANRGGTTTRCGHSRRARPPPIAVRTPYALAS